MFARAIARRRIYLRSAKHASAGHLVHTNQQGLLNDGAELDMYAGFQSAVGRHCWSSMASVKLATKISNAAAAAATGANRSRWRQMTLDRSPLCRHARTSRCSDGRRKFMRSLGTASSKSGCASIRRLATKNRDGDMLLVAMIHLSHRWVVVRRARGASLSHAVRIAFATLCCSCPINVHHWWGLSSTMPKAAA